MCFGFHARMGWHSRGQARLPATTFEGAVAVTGAISATGAIAASGNLSGVNVTAAGGAVYTDTLAHASISGHGWIDVSDSLIFAAGKDVDLKAAGCSIILEAAYRPTDVPLQFDGDPNTGLMWLGADNIGVQAAGASQANLSSGLTQFNGTLYATFVLLPESGTPSALANDVWFYAIDVAAKTAARVMCGAGGTVTTIGIEV